MRLTRSICSKVICTASKPCVLTGIHTDQNCAPTCPARSRGISVISAACPGFQRQVAGVCGQIYRGEIALEALANFPRQIVVPVDERRLQQHLIDAMLIVLRGPGGERQTKQQTKQCEAWAWRFTL